MHPKITELHGLGFAMKYKVYADHDSDTVTRRLINRFLVWFNCYLIHCLYKKQISVDISRFGSEFVAMNQCCEYLRGTKAKLRVTIIPSDGPDSIEEKSIFHC